MHKNLILGLFGFHAQPLPLRRGRVEDPKKDSIGF
jgi:hypothetical protein